MAQELRFGNMQERICRVEKSLNRIWNLCNKRKNNERSKRKILPASIHQKLLNLARKENRPLNEILQYYAIEKILYSLGKVIIANNLS